MEKLYYIVVLFILISCGKEKNKAAGNPFAGKVKQWIEYSNEGDTSSHIGFIKYSFTYDSLNGNVKKLSITQTIDTLTAVVSLLTVEHRDNTVIRVRWEHTAPSRVFNIYVNGKQATAIKEVNSNTGIETAVTTIYATDNNVDSVFDVGYDPVTTRDIKLKKFDFVNNNCVSYQRSYGGTVLYPIISSYYVSDTLSAAYTNLPNTNNIRYQLQGNLGIDNASIFRILVLDFLSVDGFYIVPKNSNLIDSISSKDVVQHFEYIYTDNRVTKMKYKYSKKNFPPINFSNYIDYY